MGVNGEVALAAGQLRAALDDSVDTCPQVDDADGRGLVDGDRPHGVRLRRSREAIELFLPVELVEDLDCCSSLAPKYRPTRGWRPGRGIRTAYVPDLDTRLVMIV